MSDEVEEPTIVQESPFVNRAVSASPLGVLALVGGVVLAVVSIIRFQQILGDVDNNDLAAAIQALELTVFVVWIAVALWGWYLVRDGLDRVETKRRVEEQAQILARIHEAVEERDMEKAKKQVIEEKSRSFWNWRRTDN